MKQFVWPLIALAAIVAGLIARVWMGAQTAHAIWMVGLVVCSIPIVVETIRDARHGRFASDIVAALAIVGAILLGHPVAGLVVVIMKRGGEALERYAEGRASAAVAALEAAAPRRAHRLKSGAVEDIDAADIAIDDHLLVRPGELVPCDGVVIAGSSELDTSSLTGEPVPRAAVAGAIVMSGSVNGAGPLELRATARAAESHYARIVELVRTAQSHKAPLQRMADRYAVWFTPATLLVCAIAYGISGDWTRVLAVLVVATPCPLILATPVAFVGGINRAAKEHIVIRNGSALEQLSRVSAVILDKTGTITLGEPRIERVSVAGRWTAAAVIRLSAAVEHGSSHKLARTIVAYAHSLGVDVPAATELREQPGRGISGLVEGHPVHVGARTYVTERCAPSPELEQDSEAAILRTFVGVDDAVAGVIEYGEELRADLPELLDRLRARGISRIMILSGDSAANVESMARRAGITDVRGDLLPEAKAEVAARLKREGETVMMVGDGTNDAPALTEASVGIAMAGHGGGITTEAADVILLRDSLSAVATAMRIGRDTTRIARQSILVGLGLSAAGMIWAAAGGLAPVAGALLQEVIDIAVILNALRTIRGIS